MGRRKCCCSPCHFCHGGTPREWQLVVAGIVDPGGVYADPYLPALNGTYILGPFDGAGGQCSWYYTFSSGRWSGLILGVAMYESTGGSYMSLYFNATPAGDSVLESSVLDVIPPFNCLSTPRVFSVYWPILIPGATMTLTPIP